LTGAGAAATVASAAGAASSWIVTSDIRGFISTISSGPGPEADEVGATGTAEASGVAAAAGDVADAEGATGTGEGETTCSGAELTSVAGWADAIESGGMGDVEADVAG
jgi:hypothetical protein